MSKESDDGIFTFIAGMAVGLLSGGLMGLLFAPKSGDELRADLHEAVRNLPGKINDEFRNPNTRTREFIDRTRYNIEDQMGKVKRDWDADRMAKAKRAEELASGYDFN